MEGGDLSAEKFLANCNDLNSDMLLPVWPSSLMWTEIFVLFSWFHWCCYDRKDLLNPNNKIIKSAFRWMLSNNMFGIRGNCEWLLVVAPDCPWPLQFSLQSLLLRKPPLSLYTQENLDRKHVFSQHKLVEDLSKFGESETSQLTLILM